MVMKMITLAKMGGYGDLIMATALFKPLIDKGYSIRFIASNHYSSVLEGHPLIDNLISVDQEKFWTVSYELGARNLNYPDWWGSGNGEKMKRHIISDWADTLNVPLSICPDLSHIPFTMGAAQRWNNTVVLQSKSNWSPYKDHPIAMWDALAAELIKLKYDVVQIGGFNDPLIKGATFMYRGGPEAHTELLKHCKVFIGPDSVFQHMAKGLDRKAIVLWGSTDPLGFGYESHINLNKKLSCQPCYREYSHIGAGNSCPFNIKCNFQKDEVGLIIQKVGEM